MPEGAPPTGSRPVRIIALMNQKGGVGKTTTTVNLAAAIAETGRQVLVVDMDSQAQATLYLGGETGADSRTVYDLLLDPALPVEPALQQIKPSLWLLPSETGLAGAEAELAGAPDRTTRLRRVLDQLGDRFEFVLIDCPPSLGLLTLNGLAAAREVFIPLQAHFLALQGVGKLLETVGLVAREINPRLRVTGIILCMHETTTTHAREVVADLTDFFEQARRSGQDVPWKTARVLSPAIRRNIKLAECPSFGQTIFDYAPSCPGAADYRALAERILADWDALLARRGEPAQPPQTESVSVEMGPAVRARSAGTPA